MKFIIVGAPMLILGIWGASYLRQALLTLASPGVPIELEYMTRTGATARFYAESYTIDLDRGTIRLTEPKLYDPAGGILAQIDFLHVSGLAVFNQDERTIRLRGSNLTGRLVRLESGQFEIQDFLPERKEPSTDIPFIAEIDGVRVVLLDRMGSPYQVTATMPELKVAGIGDNWVAGGEIAIGGVGEFSGTVHSFQDRGLLVRAKTQGAQLSEILNHLVTTPQFDEYQVSASSLRLIGPVEVFIPQENAPQVEARLRVIGDDVRYGRYFVDQGVFKGLVTARSAVGTLIAQVGANRISFEGSSSWSEEPVFAGSVAITSPGRESMPLWVREVLPPALDFGRTAFNGWVSYQGSEDYRITGNASSTYAKWEDDALRNVSSDVRLNPSRMVARVQTGTFIGAPVSGVIAFSPETRGIEGAVTAANLNLGSLAARFDIPGLAGRASITASLAGTTARPIVDFDATGSARYTFDGKSVRGNFSATAIYENGGVVVRRGVVDTPSGMIAATGNVDPSGRMNMDVRGRGLKLDTLHPDLGGTANFLARINGTPSNPFATGRIEGYGLSYADQVIPAASAEFRVNKERAQILDVSSTKGSASITGQAAYVFGTGAIRGDFAVERLQVADVLGQEVFGAVDIPELLITGTLADPRMSGRVVGKDLVAEGVRIDDLTAQLSAAGTKVQLETALMRVASGTAKGSGNFDLSTGAGTFSAQLEGLDLSELSPSFANLVTLDGRISGALTGDVVNRDLAAARGEGEISNVTINGTEVGSGPWSVSTDGNLISADLEIGQLDRFVELTGLGYNTSTDELQGAVNLFNVRAEDLVQLLSRYFEDLPYETQEDLLSINGVINLGADLSGDINDPNVDIRTIQASNLRFRDEGIGDLTARMSLERGAVNISEFLLNGPLGRFAVAGTIEDEGQIDIQGDLSNAKLSRLGFLDSRLAAVGGTADISFSATGLTDAPTIRASLEARDMLAPTEGADSDQHLRVSLDTISVSEPTGIFVQGNYFYKGFQGEIRAQAPFLYPLQIPEGPREILVTLAQRDLKQIAGYVEGIDEAKTTGTIGGQVWARGTSDELNLDGEIALAAPTLAWSGMEGLLQDVRAALSLQQQRLLVNASGQSSRGGSFAATASSQVNTFSELAGLVQQGRFADLLQNPLEGQIALNELHVRQNLENRAYVSAGANGTIDLSGTINRPSISGDLVLTDVDTVVPMLEPQGSAGMRPIVDPRFNITANLAEPAHIRTTGADLYLTGSGALTGAFTTPTVTADLLVDRGSLRLPGGTVRVEQGGTLAFNYRGEEREPIATFNVDLTGRTALTALRYGDVLERYEITLGVRGDLLEEGSLVLTAESDPPDLPQDRILAMLGQADVLGGILGTGSGAEANVRQALASYALPAMLDPFTAQLAQGIGLEFLSIEYNQFEQATVTFGKSLGSNFFIQGRRQLFEPPPGFPPVFDIRLIYRPRRLPGVLNRLTFSVGADQDRPWKISVDYTVRF